METLGVSKSMAPAALLVLTILCTTSRGATADDWIGLNNGLYFDAGSHRREGDIGVVNLRASDGSTWRLEVDCVRKLWWTTPSADQSKQKPLSQYPRLRPAFQAACKKWYEIWK